MTEDRWVLRASTDAGWEVTSVEVVHHYRLCERCYGSREVPSVIGGTDEFGGQDQGYVPCPDCEDR